MAPLEAARSGCALILGDIPSLREVWDDAAVYVDPSRPLALCAAIDALALDTPRRERLARAAVRRAAEFTSERMGRQYEALYRQLTPGQAATLGSGANSCA